MESVGNGSSTLLNLVIKSVVSRMYEGDYSTKPFSSCSASSANLSVGVPIPLTIARYGAFALWSLGLPFNFPSAHILV